MARRSKKKLFEVCMDIYRELYANSTPPANFDELVEKAETDSHGKKIIPYDDYYLDRNAYDEIVNKHIKLNKLTGYDEKSVRFEAYLGCGPTSSENKKIEIEEKLKQQEEGQK